MRFNTKAILLLIFLLFSGCFSDKAIVRKRLVVKSKNIYSNINGFLPAQFIIIEGSKIVAITKDYKLRPSDVLKDYSSYFILPGFIDAHTHLFLTDSSFDADFPGELIKNLGMNGKEREEVARRRAQAYLRAGFVAIRDLGNSGRYLDQKLSLASKKTPSKLPQILFSGPGICVGNCQFSAKASIDQVNHEYDSVESFVAARKVIDERIQFGVNFIKVYIDNIPSSGVMKRELFSKIFQYCQKKKIKLVVHGIDKNAIEFVSEFAVHSIEHANELSDLALKNIKKNNIMVVPTDLGFQWIKRGLKKRGLSSERVNSETITMFKERSLRYKKLLGLNIPFAFGSDFYFPVENIEKDFINAVFSSFDILDLSGADEKLKIKELTLHAARAIGQKELGEIQVGMQASFVILKKNPLRDFKNIRTVHKVFNQGVEVEL